ncbi:MAG: hypothetical protein NVS9B14_19940 [Candidatus Acidiferrum sp.]
MKVARKDSVYIVRLGPETHFLEIEGVSPENGDRGPQYRLQIPANHEGEGKIISSSSELGAALSAAEFLLDRTRRHAARLTNGDSMNFFVH